MTGYFTVSFKVRLRGSGKKFSEEELVKILIDVGNSFLPPSTKGEPSIKSLNLCSIDDGNLIKIQKAIKDTI